MKIFHYEISRKRFFLFVEWILFFFCFFIPAAFTGSQAENTTAFSSITMVNHILVSLPQILLLVFVIRLRNDIALKNFGVTKPTGREILFAVGHAIILLGLLLLLSKLIELLPEPARDIILPGEQLSFAKGSPLIIILLFSLVIGYREELFFRSYLLIRFKQLGLKPIAAIIVSTSLFGILHLYQGVFGFLFAAVVGLYFSFLFIKTRSLHTIALAHGLYNALMLFMAQLR